MLTHSLDTRAQVIAEGHVKSGSEAGSKPWPSGELVHS